MDSKLKASPSDTATWTLCAILSFNARPGAVFGFVGSNGPGKTTTMRMVLGTLIPRPWVCAAGRISHHLRSTPPDWLYA